MNDRDLIRELKNLMDRFFAEYLALFNEYEKAIEKDLKEMEEEDK